MRAAFHRWGSTLLGVSLIACVGQTALAADNPYLSLTNRNAFGIKPPPPPPEPAPPPPPPPSPPPNVFLTGVSHSGGFKKAYFAINRPGGKQPDYETLQEGEEYEDLKVLEIDAAAGRVKTEIAGKEMTLSFAENGLKATGGVPTAPGGVPPKNPNVPVPAAPVPAPTLVGTSGGGPVVIGRGGSAANNPGGGLSIAQPMVQPFVQPYVNLTQNNPGSFNPAQPIQENLAVQPIDIGGRIPPPPLPPPTRNTP
ncbi:MAG: hypothetical protein ACO3I0_06525 [Limisphaerales bacterium]